MPSVEEVHRLVRFARVVAEAVEAVAFRSTSLGALASPTVVAFARTEVVVGTLVMLVHASSERALMVWCCIHEHDSHWDPRILQLAPEARVVFRVAVEVPSRTQPAHTVVAEVVGTHPLPGWEHARSPALALGV